MPMKGMLTRFLVVGVPGLCFLVAGLLDDDYSPAALGGILVIGWVYGLSRKRVAMVGSSDQMRQRCSFVLAGIIGRHMPSPDSSAVVIGWPRRGLPFSLGHFYGSIARRAVKQADGEASLDPDRGRNPRPTAFQPARRYNRNRARYRNCGGIKCCRGCCGLGCDALFN
jgi:hypothetical protein